MWCIPFGAEKSVVVDTENWKMTTDHKGPEALPGKMYKKGAALTVLSVCSWFYSNFPAILLLKKQKQTI